MSTGLSVRHALSESDWEDFVAVCYFGRDGDWLDRCIRRAYLDMSRTLHGMADFAVIRPDWKTRMTTLLRQRLTVLAETAEWTAEVFDEWHKESVTSLQALSDGLGYRSPSVADRSPGPRFTVGQAQKWINMSIKYAIALGERRLPEFSRVYPVAHAPLDRIVLSALAKEGMSPLDIPWSRLDDYDQYIACQDWVRRRYPGEAPLRVEYLLWQQKESPLAP